MPSPEELERMSRVPSPEFQDLVKREIAAVKSDFRAQLDELASRRKDENDLRKVKYLTAQLKELR